MHAASRQSLATLREQLDGVIGRFKTAEGLVGLADDLYQVVDLLVTQPQLRRTLADPTTRPERRAEFAGSLFDDKLGASSAHLVRDAVSQRWSAAWDLLDALEITADEVLFGAAEQDGAIDDVEDQLFRFERILDAQSQLATLLDDAAADVQRRSEVVRELVGAKVHPITLTLLEHAVASQRKHTLTNAIDDLLELAARRRRRSMARVTSAVALTARQQARLAAALTEMYGRPINIRMAVDPSVRGGLIIQIADEVIDGSVAARLTEARTALAN
jgi:F-type H+-transporting ATPase subunit delta